MSAATADDGWEQRMADRTKMDRKAARVLECAEALTRAGEFLSRHPGLSDEERDAILAAAGSEPSYDPNEYAWSADEVPWPPLYERCCWAVGPRPWIAASGWGLVLTCGLELPLGLRVRMGCDHGHHESDILYVAQSKPYDGLIVFPGELDYLKIRDPKWKS